MPPLELGVAGADGELPALAAVVVEEVGALVAREAHLLAVVKEAEEAVGRGEGGQGHRGEQELFHLVRSGGDWMGGLARWGIL